MVGRRGAVFALGGIAMLLSGCMIGRFHMFRPLDEEKIAGIQRGVTTKRDVLRQFGPPQEIEAREVIAVGAVDRIVGARYFRYNFYRGNVFATILLLFNYADFDVKSDALLIFFDGNDVVEDYAFRKDTDHLARFGFWSR